MKKITLTEPVLDGKQVGPVVVQVDGASTTASIVDSILNGQGSEIHISVDEGLQILGLEELAELQAQLADIEARVAQVLAALDVAIAQANEILAELNAAMADLNALALRAEEAARNASASEVAAKASEVAAKASEVESKASELAAALSATAASDSEIAAKAAEVAAAASKVAAALSESNALASENAAQASKVASENAKVLAQKYANAPEGVVVESGKYSSLHWAEQAKKYAQQVFVSAGTFTPTLLQPYPDLTGVTRDTIWIVKLTGPSPTFTYTTGDLAGVIVTSGDFLFYDTPSNHWDHIPVGLVGILEVNGKGGTFVTLTADDVGAVPITGGDVSGTLTAQRLHAVMPGENGIALGSNASHCWVSPITAAGATDFANQLAFNPTRGYWTAQGDKIYTTGQKPTASEVGALPLAGGIMTGTIQTTNDYALVREGSGSNHGVYLNPSRVIIGSAGVEGIQLRPAGIKNSANQARLLPDGSLNLAAVGSTGLSIERSGHRVLVGCSASPGEYLFGGRANSDSDYKDYIRLGNNKFIYHESGASSGFNVFHEGVGSITKTTILQAPAGVVDGMYYPIVFTTTDTFSNTDTIRVDTTGGLNAFPMNNCSFTGTVRNGGSTDALAFVDGVMRMYDTSERAIHSIWGGTKSSTSYAVYVEARAFPVLIKHDWSTSVKTSASSIVDKNATYESGVAVPAGTNIRVFSDFSKGSGHYYNNEVMNQLTASDVGALPITGGTLTGGLSAQGAIRSTVNNPLGFGHTRGADTAMFGVSATSGEFVFGGGVNTTTSYTDFIRIGRDKLQYVTNNSTYDIYHTGKIPSASEVGAIANVGSQTVEAAIASRSINRQAPSDTTFNYSGFYRLNGPTVDGLKMPDLTIHCAHSSGKAYSRGIGFRYGTGWGLTTTAWDGDGVFVGQKKIYTEVDPPSPSEVGALPISGGTMLGTLRAVRASPDQFQGMTYSTEDVDSYASEVDAMFSYARSAKGSPNLFPSTNNANGVLTFNTHTGRHNHQLGFSSNGKLYHRTRSGAGFGEWGALFSEGNKPSAIDAGIVLNGSPLGSTAGWYKIGVVTMPQSASTVVIEVSGGSGFNTGDFTQAAETRIVLRAGNNNPKGITAVVYQEGGASQLIKGVSWKAVPDSNDFEVYVDAGAGGSAGIIFKTYTSVNAAISLVTTPVSLGTTKPSGITDGLSSVSYSSQYKPTASDVGAAPSLDRKAAFMPLGTTAERPVKEDFPANTMAIRYNTETLQWEGVDSEGAASPIGGGGSGSGMPPFIERVASFTAVKNQAYALDMSDGVSKTVTVPSGYNNTDWFVLDVTKWDRGLVGVTANVVFQGDVLTNGKTDFTSLALDRPCVAYFQKIGGKWQWVGGIGVEGSYNALETRVDALESSGNTPWRLVTSQFGEATDIRWVDSGFFSGEAMWSFLNSTTISVVGVIRVRSTQNAGIHHVMTLPQGYKHTLLTNFHAPANGNHVGLVQSYINGQAGETVIRLNCSANVAVGTNFFVNLTIPVEKI